MERKKITIAGGLEKIAERLHTPAEVDSGLLEPANIVDGLFMIARAIHRLAAAIEEKQVAKSLSLEGTGGNPKP